MIDRESVKSEIARLEDTARTYADIEHLAIYYIIREMGETVTEEQELDDILPALRKYQRAKKQYALNILTQEGVNAELKKLVVEINEFLQSLYSGTTADAERAILGGIKKIV